jgi:hypothetical protein
MSVRKLMRSFAIQAWEVEQAAALGWLKLYIQAGKDGRLDLRELWNSSLRINWQISPCPPARNQNPEANQHTPSNLVTPYHPFAHLASRCNSTVALIAKDQATDSQQPKVNSLEALPEAIRALISCVL